MTNALVYTSLFPSPRRPLQGLFVSELALALAGIAGVRVVKPVVAHQNPGEILSRTRSYLYGGILPVEAPLSVNVPRFFKGTDARLMALGSRAAFRRSCEGWADVVHAHFAYPDAAAAAILASRFALPLVVTVHGSDLNVLAASTARRRRVQRTLRGAAAVIAVARDLGRKVANLGVPEDRIHHVPNGVDLQKFSPGARDEARNRLGLPSRGRLILAVGNLVPVKAYDRLIGALPHLEPDTCLLLAGGGPQRESLAQLASALGVSGRVRFLGPVPHEVLVDCFRATDILAISSHSEGWPTVIHEAMACGIPVVANPVGGIPEALAAPGLGILTNGNSPEAMANGIRQAFATDWDPSVLVAAASAHSWKEIARRHLAIYEQVLCERREPMRTSRKQ
jgi:glycosyltransferase involved in cell wall biosynthesis